MERASGLDRAAAWAAALACLLFLAGIPGPSRLWPLFSRSVPPGELERSGRAVLDVLVSTPTARALERLNIRVFWADGDRYRLAADVTTDDPRIRFDDLPRGVVWVLVDAPGWARSSTQLVLGETPRQVSVTLTPAARLAVRVVDDQGAPVAGATVLVSAKDPLPFGALTDREGRSSFERLGPAPWSVRVAAKGYETANHEGVSADVTVTLRPLSTLDVRVVHPDGKPASHATVVIAGPSLWPARMAEANDAGRALISGLDPGAYDLKAVKGGEVSPTGAGVALGRGERKTVTLRLAPGRIVTARVTDGDEVPPTVIPNANVVLVERGISSFPIEGRTNQLGEVRLGPLPPGPAIVAARAEGFVPGAAVSVPDDLKEPVVVPLLRAATLNGEVVDDRGRPVDGATIEVVGTTPDGLPISETPELMAFRASHFDFALSGPAPLVAAGELGVMPGPIPPIPGAHFSPRAAEALVPAAEPWVTGFDGKFSAKPVPPGRLRALVRHAEYVDALSRPVTVGPGGEAKVRVVLVSGGSIEGRVVDGHGIPVAGARIDAAAVVGSLQHTTLSASDGTFAFAAVPERAILSLTRPEDLSRVVLREPIDVAAGEVTEIELTLPEEREDVTFEVSSEAGPVELAQLTVVSVDPSVPLRETRFTDAEGVAVLEGARGLETRVIVEAPGYVRHAANVTLGEKLEVSLVLGVLVEGAVTAVRGREVVEGAIVELETAGRHDVATTDSEGRYRFEAAAPGPATLSISHAEYAAVELAVTITPTGRPDRPLELATVNLEAAGRVKGRVVDRAERPIAGARVAVGAVASYLPMGALPPGMVQTNRKGEFELFGLDPGMLDVEAYSVDHGRGRVENVEVTAGQTTEGIVIVLKPADIAEEPGSTGNVAITLGETGSVKEPTVVVLQVAERSEAERAGLEDGDILLEIDGIEPESMEDARELLGGPEGTDVVVVVDREGEKEELSLTVRRERIRR